MALIGSIILLLANVFIVFVVLYRIFKKEKDKVNENNILIAVGTAMLAITSLHYSIKIIAFFVTISLLISNNLKRKHIK